VAVARRHRRTIGIAVAAVMVAVLAWSVLSPPEASAPGFFGVVQQYTFPLICALIAAVALAWGLKARTLVVNLLAYATIAAYLIYLVTGWVYENFVVS